MSIYDFPFIVSCNVRHICHRLRDNHVNFRNIVDFYLEIEGQGHEKRRRRLHRENGSSILNHS